MYRGCEDCGGYGGHEVIYADPGSWDGLGERYYECEVCHGMGYCPVYPQPFRGRVGMTLDDQVRLLPKIHFSYRPFSTDDDGDLPF